MLYCPVYSRIRKWGPGSRLVRGASRAAPGLGGLVGEQLLAKHDGRDPNKRHSSPLLAAFFGILLAYAGPHGMSFVTNVLPGVDAGTILRWRQNAAKFMMGTSEKAITKNVDECLLPTVRELGLQDASWVLGEDGTSTQKRVDIVAEMRNGELLPIAYGLDGDPVVVRDVSELVAAIRTRGLATTLYVIMMIPLVQGAHAIPLVVEGNANKFTRRRVHQTTLQILRVLASRGMAGRVKVGVSDGDPKLRSEQLTMMFHEGSPAENYIEIDHPFLQMRVPFIRGKPASLKSNRWCRLPVTDRS